ncbi:uncharacterized protein V6R79_006656 [Siganus canaliculatus]
MSGPPRRILLWAPLFNKIIPLNLCGRKCRQLSQLPLCAATFQVDRLSVGTASLGTLNMKSGDVCCGTDAERCMKRFTSW